MLLIQARCFQIPSQMCEKSVWSYLHVAHVSMCEGYRVACEP